MGASRGEQALDPRINVNVYQDKLDRAEEYVRDVLRIMGRPDNADNPILVRRLAHKVMAELHYALIAP